jgi:hypothetical protein
MNEHYINEEWSNTVAVENGYALQQSKNDWALQQSKNGGAL